MKLLIRAIILTGVILGFSFGSSWGMPAIPPDATLEQQSPIQCESGLILRYYYILPDRTGIVIFKKPNQDARIYLRWVPGNEGEADEVWLDNEKLTLSQLRERFSRPCSVFDQKEA